LEDIEAATRALRALAIEPDDAAAVLLGLCERRGVAWV
jgi:hypothetical protein